MGFLSGLLKRSASSHEAVGDFKLLTNDSRKENKISKLPDSVLLKIFEHVCPHASDTSYLPSERCSQSNGCQLCDTRDLASCVKTCKSWSSLAKPLLYNCVRIDAVHCCALEDTLRRKHRRNRIKPDQVPAIRLQLLQETLRSSRFLANQVVNLKLAYSLREGCIAEIAKTVSLLPQLEFVDLPEAFHKGYASTDILRAELSRSCPELKFLRLCGTDNVDVLDSASAMIYSIGLNAVSVPLWPKLEALELNNVKLSFQEFSVVLQVLPRLRSLHLLGMDDLLNDKSLKLCSDDAIIWKLPLEKLRIDNAQSLGLAGILAFFSHCFSDHSLEYLTLDATGVEVGDLVALLQHVPSLKSLKTSHTFKQVKITASTPLLASTRLKTLKVEINDLEDTSSAIGIDRATRDLHRYLQASTMNGCLPNLTGNFLRSDERGNLMPLHQTFPVMQASPTRGGFEHLVWPLSHTHNDINRSPTTARFPWTTGNRSSVAFGTFTPQANNSTLMPKFTQIIEVPRSPGHQNSPSHQRSSLWR